LKIACKFLKFKYKATSTKLKTASMRIWVATLQVLKFKYKATSTKSKTAETWIFGQLHIEFSRIKHTNTLI